MTLENILRVLAVFLPALATGALLVNWIGLARAMVRLSARAYTELHQATNRTFDPYMPIVVISAALGGAVLAALSPGLRSLSGQVAMLGALCYAATLPLSLTTNLRINKQVASWSVENPPADWSELRARWVRFHILRTLISVPALLFCTISALLESGAET